MAQRPWNHADEIIAEGGWSKYPDSGIFPHLHRETVMGLRQEIQHQPGAGGYYLLCDDVCKAQGNLTLVLLAAEAFIVPNDSVV